MSYSESLYDLLNAVLAEGRALTEFVSLSVRAPGFDHAAAKACSDATDSYMQTVARMYEILEAEPLDEEDRGVLRDIINVSYEHGVIIQDLLHREKQTLRGYSDEFRTRRKSL